MLMKTKPKLKLDWCSYKAAEYACKNWHYSKCMPVGKIVKIGVWESGKYIGCVLFSRGASKDMGKEFGLKCIDLCELTRISLSQHITPVSRIIKISIMFLKKNSPKLKIIYSYADPRQLHYGGIYQATNWIYVGLSSPGGAIEYFYKGKWRHQRSMGAYFPNGTGKEWAIKNNIKIRKPTRKHKYLMPLNKEMAKKIEHLKKSYPKRSEHESNVPTIHVGEDGAVPI